MPGHIARVLGSFVLAGLFLAAGIVIAATSSAFSGAGQGHAPELSPGQSAAHEQDAPSADFGALLPASIDGGWEKLFSAWGR